MKSLFTFALSLGLSSALLATAAVSPRQAATPQAYPTQAGTQALCGAMPSITSEMPIPNPHSPYPPTLTSEMPIPNPHSPYPPTINEMPIPNPHSPYPPTVA